MKKKKLKWQKKIIISLSSAVTLKDHRSRMFFHLSSEPYGMCFLSPPGLGIRISHPRSSEPVL
jgi:hypothetical protein